MNRQFVRFSSITALVLLQMPIAFGCTWARGYFHQITSLSGVVVGVADGDLRHPFRPLRQMVKRGDARLSLMKYSGDGRGKIVRQVSTDSKGRFDFGELPTGHYTLVIEAPQNQDRFDVEIVPLSKQTKSISIDVSPNYPDCTGGHEFISMSK